MAQADLRVTLGPGGEILEVPENEALLEKIRETPPLPSAVLLKLGAYYRGYRTNRPLGNHLTLIGLLQLVNDPEAQKNLEEVLVRTAAAAGISIGTPQDVWDTEDYFDFKIDESNEGRPWLASVRSIHFANTNLEWLIETPHPRSDEKKMRNFVIGIAPTFENLQPSNRPV